VLTTLIKRGNEVTEFRMKASTTRKGAIKKYENVMNNGYFYRKMLLKSINFNRILIFKPTKKIKIQ